ncbi:MAG: response regulator [Nitrososphaeraceae archaeon]
MLKPYYYDILIFDIKMPIMNGYELYEIVKKLDDKVKVCFLTDTILKSSKQGFSFHLLLIIFLHNKTHNAR